MIDVIICTYNRYDDLRQCLISLANQIISERIRILIVDSSDVFNNEIYKDVQFPDNIKLEHIRSKKGLTLQRNIGISKINPKSDFVCFFDDDVTLDKDYLSKVNTFISDKNNSDYVGVSGNAENEKKRNIIDRLIRKFFFITDNTSGKYLISGDSGHIFEPEHDSDIEVLSGCNMCYRSDLFIKKGLRFDEMFSHYAFMEDHDFSFRASFYGKLKQLKDAKLIHHVSPVSRLKYRSLFRMYIINSHYLMIKERRRGKIIPFFYWWRILGKLVHALSLSFQKYTFEPITGWIDGVLNRNELINRK